MSTDWWNHLDNQDMTSSMNAPSIHAPIIAVLALPVARVALYGDEDVIDYIAYRAPDARLQSPATAPARRFAQQLAAYLEAAGGGFDVPLREGVGSAYQRRVWRRLCAIPAGRPVSYGVLADEIGSGARAVAGACRANHFPLVIPCHRVVAKSGLGGFAGHRDGWQLELKQWLLRHEQGD